LFGLFESWWPQWLSSKTDTAHGNAKLLPSSSHRSSSLSSIKPRLTAVPTRSDVTNKVLQEAATREPRPSTVRPPAYARRPTVTHRNQSNHRSKGSVVIRSLNGRPPKPGSLTAEDIWAPRGSPEFRSELNASLLNVSSRWCHCSRAWSPFARSPGTPCSPQAAGSSPSTPSRPTHRRATAVRRCGLAVRRQFSGCHHSGKRH